MKRHILLVDDNPNDVELALMALQDENSEAGEPTQSITVAHSGLEALDNLREGCQVPDLVLLDLNMPHMDGLAVLDAIRAEKHLREVPVVMLTTSAEESDIQKCYAHGASAYVVKPLDFQQFRDAMNTIRNFWMNLNRPPRTA